MTKKELFYYELLKVQNEWSMKENNRPFKSVDIEEYIKTDKFRKDADRLTMAKIEEEMNVYKKMLDKVNAKLAVASWKETEEGKAYIEERKERMKSLREAAHTILDNQQKQVSAKVKELLGEQWDVTSFCDGSMVISIVEKYLEDGRPVALFGHGFDIYFRRSWSEKGKYDWEMNYGTMGCFDLSKDNSTRIQFLTGIAKFASDTTVVPALRDSLHEMGRALYNIDKECWKLEKEVENPQMPE